MNDLFAASFWAIDNEGDNYDHGDDDHKNHDKKKHSVWLYGSEWPIQLVVKLIEDSKSETRDTEARRYLPEFSFHEITPCGECLEA
jgi:hypothetical protein